MVVLFHAEFEFIPSGYIGVDMFFVISGFLILGSLIRQSVAGTLRLSDFWSRRIRRLIPAATVSTVAIVSGAWFLYPVDGLNIISRDSAAAAAYFANWNFLFNQVSYWEVTLVSPFLHYWSLSVEEQFYIFFPLLFAAILALAVKFKFSLTLKHFQFLLALFSAVSLLALLTSTTDESNLYFNTFFRLWEFGLGGLASFTALSLKRSHAYIKLLLLGLLLITTLIPNNFQYPGFATLIPVLLSAGYLALTDFSWTKRKPEFSSRLLAPLHRLGDISYSVYLWHWPLILYSTFVLYGIDGSVLFLQNSEKLAVVAAAVVVGWASYRYVEEPFRRMSVAPKFHRKWLAFGVSGLALSLVFSFITPFTDFPKVAAAPRVFENPELTPEVLRDFGSLQAAIDALAKPDLTSATSLINLTPKIDEILKSKAALYVDDCHLEAGNSELQTECVYGDATAAKKIYLVGDSHAATWFPALNAASKQLGLKLIPRTKSSCGLFEVTLPGDQVETREDCLMYRQSLLTEMKSEQPALVIVAQLFNNPGTEIESNQQRDQMNNTFKAELTDQIQVSEMEELPLLILADIPQLSFEPSRCLPTSSPADCKSNKYSYLAPTHFLVDIASAFPNVQIANLSDFICRGDLCYATNPEFILYRDRHHLTSEFSASLSYVWEEVLTVSID